MKKSKLTFIVVLAAAVAALTTVAVLVLRARQKRSLKQYNDHFDYDLDDCCTDCCGCGETEVAEEDEPAAE